MCPTPASPACFGNVRITRGENQLNGQEAEVNQKTGISRLLSGAVRAGAGLVVPNEANAPGADAGANPAAEAPAAQSRQAASRQSMNGNSHAQACAMNDLGKLGVAGAESRAICA